MSASANPRRSLKHSVSFVCPENQLWPELLDGAAVELDCIEGRTAQGALDANDRLDAEPERPAAMVENGRTRRAEWTQGR